MTLSISARLRRQAGAIGKSVAKDILSLVSKVSPPDHDVFVEELIGGATLSAHLANEAERRERFSEAPARRLAFNRLQEQARVGNLPRCFCGGKIKAKKRHGEIVEWTCARCGRSTPAIPASTERTTDEVVATAARTGAGDGNVDGGVLDTAGREGARVGAIDAAA